MSVRTVFSQLLAVILCSLLAVPTQAAIGAGAQWDIRTTGSDTNGGAFDPSGAATCGTDESLGAGVAITITLASSNTGTGSPAFSSTTHGPCNFVHIASGTSCTTGWFEITSISGSTATFDRGMGTAPNFCVGTIGGSLLTIQAALNIATNGNVEWIQAGTYTITSTITADALSGGNRTSPTLIGYQTTHGDNGTKPLITTATNSVALLQTAGAGGNTSLYLQNLAFSNTAGTKSNALILGTSAYYIGIVDCTFTNLGVGGLSGAVLELSNGGVYQFNMLHSAIIGAGGVGIHANHGTGATIVDSYFYGGGDFGILNGDIALTPDSLTVDNTIFASNAGSGIQCGLGDHEPCQITVTRSTFVSNGSTNNNGINYFTNSGAITGVSHITLRSNIFYGNTGYGFYVPGLSQGNPQINLNLDYNAWGANTIAAYPTNVPAGSHDKTLTSTPFTNAAGQDYSLNSNAGGGALLVGTGYLGVFPSGSTTSHSSIGAVQPAAGTSSITIGNATVQ